MIIIFAPPTIGKTFAQKWLSAQGFQCYDTDDLHKEGLLTKAPPDESDSDRVIRLTKNADIAEMRVKQLRLKRQFDFCFTNIYMPDVTDYYIYPSDKEAWVERAYDMLTGNLTRDVLKQWASQWPSPKEANASNIFFVDAETSFVADIVKDIISERNLTPLRG